MIADTKYILVDSASALNDLLAELDLYDIAAVDTEADPMYHYAVRLCLIQITVGEKHFLVDPLVEGLDITPIFKTRAFRHIILHGADYDLRLFWKTYGFSPESVFDTMIAGKVLGEEKLGLANLVEEYFGVKLEKGNQKANWSIRPLTEDMRKYAVLDTVYLHELCAILGEKLEKLNRFSWLTESCDQLIEHAKIQSPPKKDPWRISGSSRLSPKSLNTLKQLWLWREHEAEKLDRPPYKILSPRLMLVIARHTAGITLPIDWNTFIRLPKNFIGSRLESFQKMLEDALNIPEEKWPGPQQRPAPPSIVPNSELMELLHTWRDEKAEELQMDSSMLANRNQLIVLATTCGNSWDERYEQAHFMVWQKNLWNNLLAEKMSTEPEEQNA